MDGEPIAYLRGEKEFWGRPFAVDSRVLVPRPETEHVVETALALSLPPAARVLDLGTGSGCLAVTLGLEILDARVTGIDRDLGALAVARANARRHGVDARVRFVAGDWVTPLGLAPWDLVVSNPPYVDRSRPESFEPAVARHQPAGALFADEGGLAAYRHLFSGLRALGSDVPLVTEIGHGQLDPLRSLASGLGWDLVDHREDLAGIPRVVVWRPA